MSGDYEGERVRGPRRAARWCAPARRLALPCLAAGVGLAGCAAPAIDESVPVDGGPAWECVAVEGDAAGWIDRGSAWRSEGGSMVSAHVSSDGDPPARSRDEALTDAVSSAVTAAVDLLAERGVRFEPSRRDDLERAAVRAILEGNEPALPRVEVRDRVVERCSSPGQAGDGWRARVLAEYPIGRLRGDVNNVTWARRRAVREAGVLRASAGDFLASGRWLDGVAELGAAERALAEAGLPSFGDLGEEPSSEVESEADFLRRGLADDLAEAVDSLSLEPVGVAPAVEAGTGESAVVAQVRFAWAGHRRAAGGVPVVFTAADGVALLDAEARSDDEGLVRCGILSAYGAPGKRAIEVGIDEAVVLAAAGRDGAGPAGTDSRGLVAGLPRATLPFYVVRGGHGVSVCLEIASPEVADAAIVRDACERNLSRDGYAVVECGPDANLLVTLTASLSSRQEGGVWLARVIVGVSAIDQRRVALLGETKITVVEEIEGARRESEVAALREAGRLAAVYLSRRGARSTTLDWKRLDES